MGGEAGTQEACQGVAFIKDEGGWSTGSDRKRLRLGDTPGRFHQSLSHLEAKPAH